jgi:catechol 2,3-dioxygenase-like lactoylglutathione lyase family enzyme
MSRPRIAQIALCSNSIPDTTRVLSKAFGFAVAGGRPLWGERLARIQGLPTGASTAVSLWWLVGRQDFMQLELFTHTTPVQRPRADGWRASDLGWARWGVSVPDFDAALARLARAEVATITEPMAFDGGRRVCFIEPGTQVIVEIIEAEVDAVESDRQTFYDLAPAVHHVSVSVADLQLTRQLFLAAGLSELAPDQLHSPEHEALWGLPGASREVAVLTDGDIHLEIVQYSAPLGAPRSSDHLLSDQGFMNIALGFRDRGGLVTTFDAMIAAGCTTGNPLPDVAGGTYLSTPDGLSVELLVAPRELDAEYGFTPMPRFPRPLIWPTTDPATAYA